MYMLIQSWNAYRKDIRNKPEAREVVQWGKAYDAKPNSLSYGPKNLYGVIELIPLGCPLTSTLAVVYA